MSGIGTCACGSPTTDRVARHPRGATCLPFRGRERALDNVRGGGCSAWYLVAGQVSAQRDRPIGGSSPIHQKGGLGDNPPMKPRNSPGTRVVVYAGGATLGSVLGSLLTWVNDGWADANPLTAGPSAAGLSLGPAILVLAECKFHRRSAMWITAAVLAVSMFVMWAAFASSTSSTSAFAFLYGWIFGLPVAIAVRSASRRSTLSG